MKNLTRNLIIVNAVERHLTNYRQRDHQIVFDAIRNFYARSVLTKDVDITIAKTICLQMEKKRETISHSFIHSFKFLLSFASFARRQL